MTSFLLQLWFFLVSSFVLHCLDAATLTKVLLPDAVEKVSRPGEIWPCIAAGSVTLM